ncbi:MAG TPA: hypothetical protein VIV66_07115 [Pyrinomonadaceae bacterium]
MGALFSGWDLLLQQVINTVAQAYYSLNKKSVKVNLGRILLVATDFLEGLRGGFRLRNRGSWKKQEPLPVEAQEAAQYFQPG